MTVYKFAGFWRRLVAFMIDSTIVTIIFAVFCVIATLAFFFGVMSADNSAVLNDLVNPKGFSSMLLLVLGFFIAINTAYFTYFHGQQAAHRERCCWVCRFTAPTARKFLSALLF